MTVTGHIKCGWRINRHQRHHRGDVSYAAAASRARPSRHLGRQERGRRGRPGRHVPDHPLDRRRLGQPSGALFDGRGRQPAAAVGLDASPWLPLARRRRPRRRRCRSRGRPTRRSPGAVRLIDKNGVDRPQMDVHRGRRRERRRGTAGTAPATWSNPTEVHLPRRGPGPGRQPDRRDKVVLVDRTIQLGHLVGPSFDPRDGQTSRVTVQLRRVGAGDRGRLPGSTARSGRSGRTRRSRPGPTAGRGTARRAAGALCQARAPTASSSTRRADRPFGYGRGCDGQGAVDRGPLDWPA